LKRSIYTALHRSHLRILVQDCGGAEFQTAGNRLVVEDLKRGADPAEKGGRPKDFIEMVSNHFPGGIGVPPAHFTHDASGIIHFLFLV
jgi:hypothetical protein